MNSFMANTTGGFDGSGHFKWINEKLKTNLTCLEELASGAIFCQIIDLIYEGNVPLQKVNWTSDKSGDFITNYDILSQALKKFQLQKDYSVEKLMNGDKGEIMMMLDWFKLLSMSSRNLGETYDALGRRGGKEPNLSFAEKLKNKNMDTEALSDKTNKENMSMARSGPGMLDPKTIQKLAQFDAMKGEKEFYFSKLKDIDQVLDLYKDSSVEGLIQTIRDIIYLSPDKSGFVTDEGHFSIRMEGESGFDANQNINANFINAGETEMNEFNFNQNINLLSEQMDSEPQ